jgi:hypothetical protein
MCLDLLLPIQLPFGFFKEVTQMFGNFPFSLLLNLGKGEVLAYAEEVCSKGEPVGIQKVEVAEQEVQE